MKDNGNASGEAHTYAPKNDEYKDAVATQPISRAPGINRTTPLHSTLLVLRQASPSDKEGRRHSPSPPPSSLLFDPRDDNGTKSQDNGAKTRDNATKTNVDETEDDENGWEQLIASGESDSSMFALDSHHDEEEEEGGRDVKTHRDKRGDSAPGQLGIEPPREEVSSPACSRAATSPSVVSVPNDNSLSPACRPQTRNQRLLALCNAYFGEGSLSDWQRLMADLGFERDFTSKNQCRKALRTVWINIPQFLEAGSRPSDVVHFSSERSLARYTHLTGSSFPKKNIPAGSPLRKLLAHVGRHSFRLPTSEAGRGAIEQGAQVEALTDGKEEREEGDVRHEGKGPK